jgi:mono/diheme cytochrome c family protein
MNRSHKINTGLALMLSFFGALAACNSKTQGGDQLIRLASLTRTENITVVTGSYTELQSKVLNLFQQQCYSCHGENGSNSGNIGDVRNLEALSAKGLVKLGSSATDSKLYLRMTNKTQPMPPKGILPASDLSLVKSYLEATPEVRNPVDYGSVYQAIEKDFNNIPENEKVNVRYFHLVNKYNSGAPEQSLEQTRKALSKMLNMLSTSDKIVAPVAIDTLKLVYRVNLKDYELHRPETMYTFMLKTVYPNMTPEQREKWLPDPAEADVQNYYGARFKEIFEGKGTTAGFVEPDVHTFKNGLPVVKNPILERMARRMREAAQKNSTDSNAKFGIISAEEAADSKRCQSENAPAGVSCSNPSPLMRADWFVSQVAGNMRMRIYYHAAGMDDDTVTLDAALGIDDVEGSIYDNDPTFDRQSIPKERRIIRAGFNNSGVSINHRSFERIALEYVPGKPLWRAFEFKDKLKDQYKKHDLFKYAAGPIFEIGSDGEPGYECVNFMTDRFTRIEDGRTVRTLSLLDNGVFYPSILPNNGEPTVVTELKAIRSSENQPEPVGNTKYDSLIGTFQETFGHKDYFRWKSDDYISRYGSLPLVGGEGPYRFIKRIQCEIETSNPVAYRHETLEYLFLKRNGLQAFVNVGLKAEHLDYKIPNQRALENKEAMLIPAHDKPDLLVVGAPLSCLSCHTQGFIEKEDQVAKYISESVRPDSVTEDFWKRLKSKIADFHVPFDELKSQMAKDNNVFRTALQESGVNYKDPEPIVDTYRNWAIPGMTFTQVAAELEVSEKLLKQTMLFDKEIGDILREFTVPNATIRRAEFEKAYRKLMCKLHESCKEIESINIIPNQ